MNRREFGKIVFKGTLISIISPSILSNFANKTQAPVLTSLGKELTRGKLLSPGWHKVIIEDVIQKTSETDGTMLINIVMRALDEDAMRISQFISEKYPYPIMSYVHKASLSIENETIDLNDLIDKEINIEVQEIKFNGREMRMVKR